MSRFAIAYAASGGTSRTDARLTVNEQGVGRMFLGSSMSLPPAGELDTVGVFEGKVDGRLAARLNKLLAPVPADLAAGEAAIPGSVIRNLVVTEDGREHWQATIPGYAEPPLDEIETTLQKVMTKLAAQPAAAVRLTIDPDGAFVLTGAGTRPVELAGLGALRGTVVLMDGAGGVLGTTAVAPLESSSATLAPGEELRVPVTRPQPGRGGQLSGGLEFQLVVDGRPRAVTLQAEPARVK